MQVANLVLVRLANVEHEDIFSGIEPSLLLFWLDLKH